MTRRIYLAITVGIALAISGFLIVFPFGGQAAANHDYWHTFMQKVESNSTDTASNSNSSNNGSHKSDNATDPEEFRLAMRSLWVDHVVYTRQYIVDVAADLPSVNDTAARLLKNQEDIGDAIKPYYGEAAGDQLTDLLKQHILIAVDLVAAAKDGNTTALNAANATWYQNADDIATFLSTANPNFDKEEMKAMLNEHLRLTTNEAVARLTGDHAGDIAAFDEIHSQAMEMADGLSSGIIAQFPDQFEDDKDKDKNGVKDDVREDDDEENSSSGSSGSTGGSSSGY